MSSLLEELDDAAAFVRGRLSFTPRLGLVLGSGLGHLTGRIENPTRIAYSDIPHMPEPTIVGHGGELVAGSLGGAPVVCLSGRVHLYEGHAPSRVVFGARLLARLGAERVVLTNAAGGIDAGCSPGTLLSISDHLNLTGLSPLTGPNEDALGPRFPDMSEVYDRETAEHVLEAGRSLGLRLARGVYAGLLGPSYETPAEIRMLELLGASAVGMSTVHEAIALRHMGVRVAGISCITNHAAGKSPAPLSHEEVSAVAERVKLEFGELIVRACASLAGNEPKRAG